MTTEQFPVNRALEIIGGKWCPQLYCTLEDGPKRFLELHRSIPGISRKVLTDQLKELERLGMVERIEFDEAVLHVEYRLTDAAFTLQPAMKGLCAWGEGKI